MNRGVNCLIVYNLWHYVKLTFEKYGSDYYDIFSALKVLIATEVLKLNTKRTLLALLQTLQYQLWYVTPVLLSVTRVSVIRVSLSLATSWSQRDLISRRG